MYKNIPKQDIYCGDRHPELWLTGGARKGATSTFLPVHLVWKKPGGK